MNPKVDAFLSKAKQWQEEFEKLREILLESELEEEFKWGKPCYTVQGGNVALIHGFKEYCAVLFMKGTLLSDPEGILVQQTENVQAARQARYTNLQEIIASESSLKACILEAIEVEKAGLEVQMKKTAEFDRPEEFDQIMYEMPDLKAAWEALTPGRQRGYLLHFSGAKQSKTRISRIEKAIPKIMEGKGPNDR